MGLSHQICKRAFRELGVHQIPCRQSDDADPIGEDATTPNTCRVSVEGAVDQRCAVIAMHSAAGVRRIIGKCAVSQRRVAIGVVKSATMAMSAVETAIIVTCHIHMKQH